MLVSRSVNGSAFAATMESWCTVDGNVYYFYTQEDNTITVTINDSSVEVVMRVSTLQATYSINIYCSSVIDIGEYVRENDFDEGTVDVNFYEDGEYVGQLSGDMRFGYYPAEIVVPPPFLPYHDGYDIVRIPLIAATSEGAFTARTPDGSYRWTANDNLETAVTIHGSYGLLWRAAGADSWSYSQPIKIQNGCETINLQWYGRNGIVKAWVFEVSAITTEVPDPVEIITARGIGLRRIGAPSRTVTVRTSGCNIYTRKWLSDLAISPYAYWYRRYYDADGEVQTQLVPVTCESVEIDLSERVADFEAVINIEKGRTL